MVSIRSVLRTIPDPRGKKGRLHRLDAILSLILLSMLSGRKGMKAAFHPGRGLSRKHLDRLGFRRDRKSPCHATLTETLRVLDPDVMAAVFAQVTVDPFRNSPLQPCEKPLKHQRHGQKPPRNSTILHTTCKSAQFLSAHIFALNLNPSTHNSLPLQMNAARDADVQQFGNPKKQVNSRDRWYNAEMSCRAVALHSVTCKMWLEQIESPA